MKEGAYHTPVLLKDCIEALHIRPEGTYVDATFGGGGHSREILEHISTGKLFGFDCDEDAVKNKPDDKRFILIPSNFRDMKDALLEQNVTEIDGLLADLGVSSHQFDSAERGFSTRFDSELDMRMNKEVEVTAQEIIETYSEEELRRIFWEYGELNNARQVVKKIAANRSSIRTVNDLKNTIASCAERGKENQFYAKVFQALRIEVNDELDALKDLLIQSSEVLKEGGRIAVICYHSLEDRIVKNFFRFGKFEGEAEKDIYGNVKAPFKAINKRPIVPGEEEIQQNSRARSAKLRVAEKQPLSTSPSGRR
ncbi:MAG: 16S rRNA (cytosine(1402)-N(4))-methyltransferase RsmH [Bacteroidetes bacterium]|nr:16S rRNA (cytosine(1402)-N(4))-methyltransferase RsmH [Bacteroidota bacterium]